MNFTSCQWAYSIWDILEQIFIWYPGIGTRFLYKLQLVQNLNLYITYRIFCNKRPPPFSTFAKFIFRGFTSLSTANTFAIPGFRKMVHFSTSQANIAYEK